MHHRGIMINPSSAPLEQRGDDDYFFSPGDLAQRFGARSRNGFGEFEIAMILALAKVARAKQLLQADDLRAFLSRRFDALHSLGEIGGGILGAAHLHQGKFNLIGFVRCLP